MAQKFRKKDYPIVSVQGAEFLDMLFAVHPFIFFFNFKVRLKEDVPFTTNKRTYLSNLMCAGRSVCVI